jgi:hypothetical protein
MGSETEIAAYAPQLRTDVASMRAQSLRHIAVRTNRHTTMTEDARFLEGDLLTRVTQVIHVIDVHAGHNRDLRIEHVHRIQPATQSHFKDGDIHFVCDETLHRGKGAKFEIGQRDIATHLLYLFERSAQLRITRLLFGDAYPLVVIQ